MLVALTLAPAMFGFAGGWMQPRSVTSAGGTGSLVPANRTMSLPSPPRSSPRTNRLR
nr:hypothetical protein [Nocardia aurea]